MLNDRQRGEISRFIKARIAAIMEWYIHGDAVDCAETRTNINNDLDSVFPATEKKFYLKKIKLVLRVRSTSEPGVLKVRAEKLDIC